MVRAYMRGICNKSGHTCAPFNLYHGSRVSSFNERPRPHTSRWNGSPVSSSSASRTAAPCGAFRFVPRPRGSAIVVSRVTNRIKAASRHLVPVQKRGRDDCEAILAMHWIVPQSLQCNDLPVVECVTRPLHVPEQRTRSVVGIAQAATVAGETN